MEIDINESTNKPMTSEQTELAALDAIESANQARFRELRRIYGDAAIRHKNDQHTVQHYWPPMMLSGRQPSSCGT